MKRKDKELISYIKIGTNQKLRKDKNNLIFIIVNLWKLN